MEMSIGSDRKLKERRERERERERKRKRERKHGLRRHKGVCLRVCVYVRDQVNLYSSESSFQMLMWTVLPHRFHPSVLTHSKPN